MPSWIMHTTAPPQTAPASQFASPGQAAEDAVRRAYERNPDAHPVTARTVRVVDPKGYEHFVRVTPTVSWRGEARPLTEPELDAMGVATTRAGEKRRAARANSGGVDGKA